ncbi:MAG: hotdog domain-containing protein [Actinomycetota bacterium]|nr:hotdog domain-containing protein [Actinomycetota bacterium]
MVGSAPPGEPSRPDDASPAHDPPYDMAGHVLAKIGLRIAVEDGPPRFDLHLEPVLLDGDGHLDFGVLGVYLDMASGQIASARTAPWVHADITAHRLAPPRGSVLSASSTALRLGRRTGVVELDVHDELGTHVARSTQELVFVGPERPPEDRGEMRARFYGMFDGRCSLDAPMGEVLGIERRDEDGAAVWELGLSDASRNGFGGLHGGVAIALVEAAAVGAVVDAGGGGGDVTATCRSASVRYLAPGMVGPFRAAPTIVARHGGTALVRVGVHDAGAEDRLTIVAEVHIDADR